MEYCIDVVKKHVGSEFTRCSARCGTFATALKEDEL